MNNNICQFYVILGNKNFIAPIDNNVYINATNVKGVNELSKNIIDTYKEKAKLGIKVGSEIIFLIPDNKYKNKTEEIIKQLKVNGRVEVMIPKSTNINKSEAPEQIKEIKIEVEEKKKEDKKNDITKEVLKEEKVELKEEPKIQEKTTVYQPSNNIYRGTINPETYKGLKKTKKNNTPAIIIFVISLIFFIISLILLFFM